MKQLTPGLNYYYSQNYSLLVVKVLIKLVSIRQRDVEVFSSAILDSIPLLDPMLLSTSRNQ